MVYIKVEAGLVQLAGTVATQEMIDSGFFLFEEEIPALTEFDYLTYDNGVLTKHLDAEKLQKTVSFKVQNIIDDTAKKLGFDDINSIAKYMGFDNKFRVDAESLAAWTASVWEYIEDEFNKVLSGERDVPSEMELISEVPIFAGLPEENIIRA